MVRTSLKLRFSPTSPYARKVLVTALETGLDTRIERIATGPFGQISTAYALGYLDLCYAELGWRDGHGALAGWYKQAAARDSMKSTAPDTR